MAEADPEVQDLKALATKAELYGWEFDSKEWKAERSKIRAKYKKLSQVSKPSGNGPRVKYGLQAGYEPTLIKGLKDLKDAAASIKALTSMYSKAPWRKPDSKSYRGKGNERLWLADQDGTTLYARIRQAEDGKCYLEKGAAASAPPIAPAPGAEEEAEPEQGEDEEQEEEWIGDGSDVNGPPSSRASPRAAKPVKPAKSAAKPAKSAAKKQPKKQPQPAPAEEPPAKRQRRATSKDA